MADPLDHRVILASAGTGKTFALTNRLIALLAWGAPPQTILASTFTRKAAGEILHRVILRLARAAQNQSDCAELSAHTGAELTLHRCGDLLAALLDAMHRLSIQTIDAFFLRIAGAEAFELGLAGGWRIADDAADQELRDEALARALETGDHDQLLAMIEMVQQQNPGRSVHGAITRAIDESYQAFLQGEDDLACWLRIPVERFPLDDEALARARDAIAKLDLPLTKADTPVKSWVNSIATTLDAIDTGSWEELVAKGIVGKIIQGEPTFDRRDISLTVTTVFTPIIEHARAVLLERVRQRNRATFELLSRFHAEYRELKRRTGQYRFDDIPRLLMGAGSMADLEHLYYRLDARIGHVLLDEFQDTSLEQFALMMPMLDEVLASDDRTVLCVGDVKQSLYSWRNAEPLLLSMLDTRWPQMQRSSLRVSYRSSPAVLDAVNAVFSSIENSPPLSQTGAGELWRGRFETHEPADALKNMPGLVRLIVAPAATDDDEDEAMAVLRCAAERVAAIRAMTPDASVGVLVRRNLHIATLIHLLGLKGIEASAEGGNPLTDSMPVATALSLIHLADHPGDTMALFQVAMTPMGVVVGIEDPLDADAGQLVSARMRRRLARRGYAGTLRWIMLACASSMDRRGLARFEQLIDLAQDFDRARNRTPCAFVSLAQAARVESSSRKTVRVMTIHTAKGLEFDAVILPELDQPLGGRDGKGPTLVDRPDPLGPIRALSCSPRKEIRALDAELEALHHQQRDRVIAEDLCGLYVAMTRAISRLEMVIKPSHKPPEARTAACVLRAALAPDLPADAGTELYRQEHGRISATGHQGEPTVDRSGEPMRIELRLLPAQRVSSGRLARVGPSSLAGGHRVRVELLLRTDRDDAMRRGELIHAWFEQIGWIEDGVPSDDDLLRIADDHGFARDEARQALASFHASLRCEAITQALSRETHAQHGQLTLARERAFAVRIADPLGTGETLCSGYFDRLVVASQADRPVWARVLDFKTDAIEPGDEAALAEMIATYRPQMEAYRRSAGAMLGLEASSVEVALVLTGPGLVVEIPAIDPATGANDG